MPHQVAFNRRFAPLVREMRRHLKALPEAQAIQHLHYEMTRVDRRDPDFSVTAIHGIDAVRYLAASDFAEVRFRYQEHPALGPGVANIFMDAVMASGATAHLAFCPNAGPPSCGCNCAVLRTPRSNGKKRPASWRARRRRRKTVTARHRNS